LEGCVATVDIFPSFVMYLLVQQYSNVSLSAFSYA